MKDSNWLWKPDRGVTSAISRGNRHFDPMRDVKARKRAEVIGFRDRREGETWTDYDFALRAAEREAKRAASVWRNGGGE